ncbi:MAG TPA: hypothetical protein V6D09_14125 [Leptolyngbyaceae cyanobacterium]
MLNGQGDKGLGGQGERTKFISYGWLGIVPCVTLSPCPFLTRELLNQTVLAPPQDHLTQH